MDTRICYHCRQPVEPGEAHDCWTTTPEALTGDLDEDLLEAWQRLREVAGAFGPQRIYASHKSIMFARKHCYFFVRPRPRLLEVCFFLGAPLKAAGVRKTQAVSRAKVAHFVHVTHRDQVEPPLTEWLHDAYEFIESPEAKAPAAKKGAAKKPATKKPATKKGGPKKRPVAKKPATKKPARRPSGRA